MKFNTKVLAPMAVLAITATFSGCNLFDKVDDITIPSEIEVVWEIDENSDGTNAAYSHTKTVSLEDDPELAKYINKIKDVKLEKVTYRIADYNAEPHNDQVSFEGGKAVFSSGGSSTAIAEAVFSESNVNLSSLPEGELEMDASELEALAAVLKQEKELDMNANGTLSRTPVSFKIISKFHVKVTAEVLD